MVQDSEKRAARLCCADAAIIDRFQNISKHFKNKNHGRSITHALRWHAGINNVKIVIMIIIMCVALCYVTFVPPPRHQHPRVLSFIIIVLLFFVNSLCPWYRRDHRLQKQYRVTVF